MAYQQFINNLDIDPILKAWYVYAGIWNQVCDNLWIAYLNENVTETIQRS